MMDKFKKNNAQSKLFSKKCTKFYHQDLILVKHADLEENVFSLNIINHKIFTLLHDIHCLVICYKKNVLPVYMFPSTNEMNDIIDCHRLSAKINNLLYMNFEITEPISNKLDNKQNPFHYFLYFNFNSNKHQDVTYTCELLETTINSLL